MLKYLLVVVILLTGKAKATVWDTENSWNYDFEQSYSEFIEKLPVDIYSNKKSPYYGIKADCADAVYTTRMIFAYENKLPFKIVDPSDSRRFISQSLSRWDSLSDKERFFRFVDYINTLTTTWTLQFDSYPVKLSQSWVRPGGLYLHPRISSGSMFTYGHAYLIRNTQGDLMEYISSTSPRNVKEMTTRYGHDYAPYITGGGYRVWKQSKHYTWDSNDLPGFSMEQFQIGSWREGKKNSNQIGNWQSAVRMKLGQSEPSYEEKINAHTHNLCVLLKDRVWIVSDGWKRLTQLGGQCMSQADEDDYSTPSRDKKILTEVRSLENALDTRGRTFDDLRSALEKCTFEVLPGRVLNSFELIEPLKAGKLNSDPNFPPEARWGLIDWDISRPSCQR